MLVVACVGCTSSPSSPSQPPGIFNEQDRQVWETVLLELLSDSELNMTRVLESESIIVLSDRTADGTGMIRREQMRNDIGEGHSLADDLQHDLLRRNEISGSYDSYLAPIDGLTFDDRMVVTNIEAFLNARKAYDALREAHPLARAWVQPWLPGYSKDGTRAVARAWIGPSAHGAVVTALLEKRGEKWVVKWHHVAYFV